MRLGRVQAPCGEEDVLRMSRPHEVGEVLHGGVPVAEAQARRGNREHRVGRRDADVAADRHVHAAADAITADAGDRGLLEFVDALERPFGHRLVAFHRFLGRAHVLELRDVRAGDKGLPAFAGKHDHAHVVVARGLVEERRYRFPHVDRERVVLLRIVEADVQHGAVEPRLHALGAGRIGHVVHQ